MNFANILLVEAVMVPLQSSFKLMSIMGLAPNQKRGAIKWIYLAFVVYNLVPQIYFLTTFYWDVVQITKALPLFFENMCLLLTILTLIHYKTELHSLWNGIMEFFNQAEQYLNSDEGCKAELRSFGIIKHFGIVIVSTWISFVILPMLIQIFAYLKGNCTDQTFQEPFNYRYFYNHSVSGIVYQLTYLTSSATIASVSFGIIATDTLFCSFCIHFVGMIRVVRYVISTSIKETNGITLRTKHQKHHGAEIVQPHVAVLKLFAQFKRCFSPIIFLHFISSIFVICACIFQSMLAENNLSNFVMIITFDAAGILQLMFFCWLGTEVTTEHLKISDEIYMLPWYECTPSVNKEFLIIMQVAQKPLLLTGFGIFKCNMETFIVIMNTALSAVTVLQSLKV